MKIAPMFEAFSAGADKFKNFKLSNLYAYWILSAQLIAILRKLPIGTKIGKISLQ
jgi:hypothetical protein